jgi:hypothetical protein
MITALFDEILVGNLNPSSLMRRAQNITFEKYTCPELFFFFLFCFTIPQVHNDMLGSHVYNSRVGIALPKQDLHGTTD